MRRRLLVLGALAVMLVLYGLQWTPSVSADSVAGNDSPGCQTRWTLWDGSVRNVSRLTIQFRLNARHSGGGSAYFSTIGRWELSSGVAAGSTFWASPVVTWASYGQVGMGAMNINLDPGWSAQSGVTARYVVWVPNGYAADACFSVDAITVTRYFFGSGATPPPPPSGGGSLATPTPSAPGWTPAPTPSGSPGPSASPEPGSETGWCSVYNGSQWEWVECAVITPTPTPSPSPSVSPSPSLTPSPSPGAEASCPTPFSGPGTFTFHTTWNASECVVWTATTVTSSTVVSATWTGSGYQSVTPSTNGGPGLLIHTTGGGSPVWLESISCGAAVIGAFGFHTPVGGTWAAITCNGGAFGMSGLGSGVAVYITSGATQNDSGPNGLDGTLVVTVTGLASPTPSPSAAPSPSPSPSPAPTPTPTGQVPGSQWCLDNPDTLPCITMPPDWGQTPDPSGLPGDASNPSVPGDALAQLVEDARGHTPFGELGQVADALTGGLDNAEGGAVDYCFTLPWWTPIGTQNVESCLPMEDVAGWASPVRGILLAAFVLLFSAVVLRRVTENV